MPKQNDDSEFLNYSEHELDKEWQEQPHTFHKYAVILAAARLDHGHAKQAFDLAHAEISRGVRGSPERYGVDKVTEDSIKAAIIVQAEYQRALRLLNEAKYDVDIAEAAVDALQQKKSALENAVVLWSRDYFSAPKLKKEDNQRARDKQEEVTSSGRFERTRKGLNENR